MKYYNFVSIKTTLISLLTICAFSMTSFSQITDGNTKNNFWKNIQYGGGIGLNFGDGFFSGGLAPNALYRFSPYVATGVGVNFQYSSQRDVFKSTVLGASILGLFNPIRDIQVSTEFEQLHVNRDFNKQFVDNRDDAYWYPALFLGLGYTSNNVTFGIRYDLLYNERTSIQNEAWMPFVRFWF